MTKDQMIEGHLYSLPEWMRLKEPIVVVKCKGNILRYLRRVNVLDARWEVGAIVGSLAGVSKEESDGWNPVLISGLLRQDSVHKVSMAHVRNGPNLTVRFITNKKDEHLSKNVNYIGGEYRIVKCEFPDSIGKFYNYKIDIDVKVKEHDLVVVESSNGFGLVEVIKVLDNCVANAAEVQKATAWVVSVVDVSRQDARKKATEERDYILQQLDEKKKAFESLNAYALLAQADPSARALVEKLNQLGS